MKVYKVELMIIDFDNVGSGIKDVIEAQRYPNHCISPTVMKIEERDIGEWYEQHPLNLCGESEKEYKRLFQ